MNRDFGTRLNALVGQINGDDPHREFDIDFETRIVYQIQLTVYPEENEQGRHYEPAAPVHVWLSVISDDKVFWGEAHDEWGVHRFSDDSGDIETPSNKWQRIVKTIVYGDGQ